MVTNDDRRRVARALRHYAHSDIDGGLLPSLKDAAEIAGGTWRTLFIRLADLIDPGLTEVNGGDDEVNEANGAEVDRDALLAIADRLEAMPPGYTAKGWGECIARLIREACGEVA